MTIQGDMIFDAFESELVRRGDVDRTLDAYRWAVSNFPLDPAGTTQFDIEGWLHSTGWAPSTQRTNFMWIRGAFRYGVKRGLIDHDPTDEVRLPRIPLPDPVVLSAEQVRAAAGECRDELDLRILNLLRYTGMRLVELRRLTINDVERGRLHIHGKGGPWRWLPRHPEIGDLGRGPWIVPGRRGPMSPSAVQRRVARFAGCDPKDFRSTVGTHLGYAGVQESVAQAILGHSPVTVYQKHYRSVSPDEMLKALLLLPW